MNPGQWEPQSGVRGGLDADGATSRPRWQRAALLSCLALRNPIDLLRKRSSQRQPSMNPEAAPKLNPWPFIAGDLALLGVGALIAFQTPPPLTGAPLLAVVACVALGAVCVIVPFLLNYSRRQELFLLERQNEIAALAQSTATSAEQLSIASASLHGIADTSARTLRQAEALPHKLQEKINEFKSQLNEVAVTDNEALAQEVNTLRTGETERLESAVTAIRKIASELAALDASNRKHIAEFKSTLDTFAQSVQRASDDGSAAIGAAQAKAVAAIERAVQQAVRDIEGKLGTGAARAHQPPNPPTPAPSSGRRAPELPGDEHVPSEPPTADAAVVDLPDDDSPPAREPSARADGGVATLVEPRPALARKRPPRKVVDTPELSLGFESASTLQPSTDGLTRLAVTAYIGIGNKLFVRGEGPGLSWEKGVPLQFVSIGKWRWETADAAEPVTLKLLKNDEQECTLGEVTIAPGQQCDVSANF